MASPSKQAALIGKLIEDIDISMLTTIAADGDLVSRPLSTQRASFDGKRVWFLTEADSPKIAEIRRHGKVNLAYASKEKNTYVSLAGDARVSRDRARIEEFWSDAMKAFFPKGKDDPNLVLLEVEVRTVEYWDGPSSLLGKMISFVVARVTKKEEVMGENRIVDLKGARTTSRLPPSHADAKGRAAGKARAQPAHSAAGTAAKKTAKKTAKKKTARTVGKPAAAGKTAPRGAKAGARKAPAKAAAGSRPG